MHILNKQILLICSRKNMLAAALSFTLLIRLLTLQPLDDAGDSKMYMDHVKTLQNDPSEYVFDHWSTRMGIIVPVFLNRIIFDGSAVSAYVLPILLSLILTLFLFLISERFYGKETAFIAAFLLTLYPEMVREGSQILPGVFSMSYVLISFFLLDTYVRKKKVHYLILSAVFMFFTYESHMINVFFAPGFVLYLLVALDRPWKEIIIFGSILFALFLIETVLYNRFTPFSLGVIDIVRSSHLTGNRSLRPIAPWKLFYRFVRPGPLFILILIVSSVNAGFILAKKNICQLAPVFPVASYFFFLLISVKSINPLIPALPMNARYLDASVPLLILFSSSAVVSFAYSRIMKKKGITPLQGLQLQPPAAAAVLFTICITVYGMFFFKGIPGKNIYLTAVFDSRIDDAVKNEIPMVYQPFDAYMLVHSDDSDTEDMPYWHERRRSDKNVKFINAFMIDGYSRYDRMLLHMDDGIPFAALTDQSSMSGSELVEYFRNSCREILLINRRPFSVERTTTGGYRKLYEEYLETTGN